MIKGCPVWLAIESEISYELDDSEIYTLQTEGCLFEKNKSIYIVYEETEISGMKGDKTILKIDDNMFSMRRYGDNTSELVFEPEVKTSSVYQTSQGMFSMFCYTKQLQITKEPFEVEVRYDLVIEGLAKSNNRLRIYFLDDSTNIEINA